jgi:translation initiation factor IF-1
MAGESAFKVEGLVVETLPNRLYRVELSNGHRVLAYAIGKAKESFAAKVGDKVKLQLSSYDLSEGRIILETVTK